MKEFSFLWDDIGIRFLRCVYADVCISYGLDVGPHCGATLILQELVFLLDYHQNVIIIIFTLCLSHVPYFFFFQKYRLFRFQNPNNISVLVVSNYLRRTSLSPSSRRRWRWRTRLMISSCRTRKRWRWSHMTILVAHTTCVVFFFKLM